MDAKDLQEKGQHFIARTKERFNFTTDAELTLFLIAKLTEETGELTDEILGEIQLQRKSKLEKRKQENLKEEFADVLIVLAALAEKLGINLEELIQSRLTRIKHPGE